MNETTLGKRLEEERTKRDLTQRNVALKTGISNGTISRVEKDLVIPDTNTLNVLASFYNVSINYLLYGKNIDKNIIPINIDDFSVEIPILGRIPAGTPIEAVEDKIGTLKITAEMAKHGEHFALQVTGDSMSPTIEDGDVVIVRQQYEIENNKIGVVIVNGESEATLKRVKIEPDGLWLIPDNLAHKKMFYSKNDVKTLPVKIIGKVVELKREL